MLPPPGAGREVGAPAKHLDTLMMIIGGKERTEAQWAELLAASGWKLEGVTVTPAPICQLLTASKK